MNIFDREFLKIVDALNPMPMEERKKLAIKCGVSVSAICQIRDGRSKNPRLKNLAAMHHALFNPETTGADNKSVEHEAA